MASNMAFSVTRKNPILIPPSTPTPYEFKPLSDIDDHGTLRFLIPGVHIYQKKPSFEGRDPVVIIRDAIAKALVFYYPFAGRLREADTGKLAVECTGEGILFVEADADVTLRDIGDELHPPFSCVEELLCDVPGSAEVLDCPLLLIQVTRLKCGGFIVGWRLNHTMSDAIGLVQFLSGVGEIARGAKTLSTPPVWDRHLLTAQHPHHVSCKHREYDIMPETKESTIPLDDIVNRSFFFGDAEISALRRHLPSHLRSFSKFELITACLWRCRTIALFTDLTEDVRLLCLVNARNQVKPPLPVGYYGNACAFVVVSSNAGDLCKKPLHYALDLIRMTKLTVTDDYMKSLASLIVAKGRQPFTAVRSFLVSDVSPLGFENVDFGWGKAVYGGPICDVGPVPCLGSFYVPFTNDKGEKGRVVPVWLPAKAMNVFVRELEMMLKNNGVELAQPKVCISSKL